MSNIYFSSDFHLGHTNISGPKQSQWKSGYRNFNSVEQMNQTILQNINKTVKYDDTLIFAGDFCFGGHENTPLYRNQINCHNVIWIDGNHDSNQWKYDKEFLWTGYNKPNYINNLKITPNISINIEIENQKIFISHYKHGIWEGSHKGYWHLYGHSHASAEHWEIGKSMDIGIDNAYKILGEYRPFSFYEIKKIMDKRNIHYVDHHNKNTNVK